MALSPIRSCGQRLFRPRRRAFLELLERRDLLSTYTTPEDSPLNVVDAGLAGATIVARPEHGKLTLNTTGGFTYAPNLNYNGTDRFLYTSSSAATNTTATGEAKEISISVTPVNDPPEAHNDTYPARHNTPLKIEAPGVLKNDTDVDSEHVKAILVGKTTHGDLTVGDDGSFTYSPNADFTGLDTFTYQATDGAATSAVTTVGINVAPAQTAPVARDDVYFTAQNAVLNQPAPGVLGNDTGINGRPLKASLERDAEHGKVVMNDDGSFTYKPAQDFVGADKFVYRATDVSPLANPLPAAYSLATVTIYVRPVGPIIVANNDSYPTPQNTPLEVAAPGVLSNDRVLFPPANPTAGSSDGTPNQVNIPLSATLVTDVAHGTLELKSDGSFKYVPFKDYSGTDRFTYRATTAATNNGAAGLATGVSATDSTTPTPIPIPHDVATVTITIKPLNTPPEARDDHYSTVQETPLSIIAPGVLANDHGPDGHPLAAVLVTGTSNADLNLKSDGSFTYAPHAGFTGSDTFTYRAVNPTAAGGTTTAEGRVATVTIFVQALHPPVFAFDDTYRTPTDTTLKVEKPGVLANDKLFPPPLMMAPNSEGESSDDSTPRFAPLPFPVVFNATLLSKPAHGTLALADDGSLSYIPDPGFSGADTFTYRASATTVVPTTSSGEGELTTANLPGATSDRPCLVNPDGTATCPPQDGTDDVGTVTIYVKAPEPPPGPVAQDDSFTTAENTPLGVPPPGVLRNDFVRPPIPLATNDANHIVQFPLNAVLVTDVSHGKLSLNADGSFKYTPDADFVGDDKFTYQAQEVTPTAGTQTTDPTTGATPPILSNIATVTIHVVTALAHSDSYSTPQDTQLKVDPPGVLGNDNGGSQAHPLVATLVADALHGKLTLNSDGSFTYLPNSGYSGPDIFSYRAGDGTSPGTTTSTSNAAADANHPVPIPAEPVHDGDVAFVKIFVRPAATNVEAHNDKYPTPVNVALKIDAPGVLANDSGPAGHSLSASLVDQPSHGKLTLGDGGGFTYTPDQDFVGEDHFVYRASDRTLTPNTATSGAILPGGSLAVVTIYVLPTDPLPTFIPGPNQSTTDESGPQKIADWATLVAVGADGKPASFVVTSDNPSLFKVVPTIDATGQLTYTPAPNMSGLATVTVQVAGEGESAAGSSEQFTISVDKPHPLTNAIVSCDVNGSGACTPADALDLINNLNSLGPSTVEAAQQRGPTRPLFLDVNKDGLITARDAMIVINYLNSHDPALGPEGEAAAATDSPLLLLIAQDVADATLGRRRSP